MSRKVTFKYKVLNYIEMFICGVLCGAISSSSAVSYINENVDKVIKSKYFEYIVNVIFFNDNYKKIQYMQGNIMKLLTILLYFYIPPLLLILYKYSRENEKYYSMLMTRLDSRKKVIKNIRKKPFLLFLTYVIGFIGCITMLSCFSKGYIHISRKAAFDIIMLVVSRIIVLTAFGNILFIVFLKYDAGISFFAGMLLFFGIAIVDINVDKINILLYHSGGYYIEGIIFWCLVWVIKYTYEKME